MIMNQKGNDGFQTPKHLFNQLNWIFNFTVDIACTRKNCLCSRVNIDPRTNKVEVYPQGAFFDEGQDGLKMQWNLQRIFCNPPFSNKAKWIEKAHNEVVNGNCPIVVMLLPTNCMDSKAWHKYIEGKMHYEILKGRVSFIDPKTGKPKSGNNSGTVIVYFKKKITR